MSKKRKSRDVPCIPPPEPCVSTETIHVRITDQVTPWGNAHIACCPFCAGRMGGPTQGLMRLEQVALPPEPTGWAKHRKEEP